MAYTVDDTVKLTGIKRGNIGPWTTRGHIPAFPFGLADVMSLLTMQKLTERGLRLEAAAAIAWAVRDNWQEVLLADSAEHDHERQRWLVVGPAAPGAEVPFEYHVGPPNEATVNMIAAFSERGGAITVPMSAICGEVLAAAARHGINIQVPA